MKQKARKGSTVEICSDGLCGRVLVLHSTAIDMRERERERKKEINQIRDELSTEGNQRETREKREKNAYIL